MAAVLPESMNRLNVENTQESLSTIEAYIRYMGERIEFYMRNMTKSVSDAGVSSVEVYAAVTALSNTVGALQSTVNSLNGSVTGLGAKIADIEQRLSALEATEKE